MGQWELERKIRPETLCCDQNLGKVTVVPGCIVGGYHNLEKKTRGCDKYINIGWKGY